MNNPENLREVSEKVLYGLTADDSLKMRILQKAADTPSRSRGSFRFIPSLCSAMAVLMLILVLLNGIQPVNPSSSVEINVFSAGSTEGNMPDEDFSGTLSDLDPVSVVSVALSDTGAIDEKKICETLISMLQQEAVLSDYKVNNTDNQLIITLNDGSSIRYNVEEPYLEGDKCWICPGFFTMLHQQLDQH